MRAPMDGTAACRLCGRDIGPRSRSGSNVYCKHCTAKADRKIAKTVSADCKECGKPFPTRTRSVRYCSDACRTAASRRSHAERQRRDYADPEKRALLVARLRLSAAARRARKRGDKPPRVNRDVEGLEPNPRSAEPYACALCGRDFVPYGGARPIHCKRCSARMNREMARVMAVDCKECGKRFSTPNRTVRYCSKACSAAGQRRSSNASARRDRADPEKHAMILARQRAWAAARRAKKRGAAAGG